jgi:hypothetical protein
MQYKDKDQFPEMKGATKKPHGRSHKGTDTMHAPVPQRSVDLWCIPKPFVADATCEMSVHDVLAPMLGDSNIQGQDSITTTTTPPTRNTVNAQKRRSGKKRAVRFFGGQERLASMLFVIAEKARPRGAKGGRCGRCCVLCRRLNSKRFKSQLLL